MAHAYSARKIIAFDINPSRVEFAKKYLSPLTGKPIIDHVYHIEPLPEVPEHDTATNGDVSVAETGEIPVAADQEAVHEDTVGDIKWEWAKKRMTKIIDECGLAAEEGVDRVVEASGAEDAMLHGVAICKEGGICKSKLHEHCPFVFPLFNEKSMWNETNWVFSPRVVLQVGLGHVQTHIFPTIAVTNKELDVRGITRYTASCFPSAIDMLSRGVVDLKPLITAIFPLSRAKEALEAVASGKEIKVLIKNQEV